MAAPEPLKYRIVVRGVKPDRTIDEVVEVLSHMSMKPPATLRRLLDGRRVVVKRTFEVQKAAKYKRALDKIGCVCTIEADSPAPVNDTNAPAITVNFTSSVSSLLGTGQPRQLQFGKRPRPGLRTVVGSPRSKQLVLGVALLAALYFGYKTFLG